MNRLVVFALIALGVVACSTRSVVLKPDEVSSRNDPQWVIKSEPTRR